VNGSCHWICLCCHRKPVTDQPSTGRRRLAQVARPPCGAIDGASAPGPWPFPSRSGPDVPRRHDAPHPMRRPCPPIPCCLRAAGLRRVTADDRRGVRRCRCRCLPRTGHARTPLHLLSLSPDPIGACAATAIIILPHAYAPPYVVRSRSWDCWIVRRRGPCRPVPCTSP
jgi:hypothetical protein